MVAQLYFPRSLSTSRLDSYLASGWFRSCNYLHRFKLLSIDNDVSSVVNVRLGLEDYQPSKSLRKLQRKIEGRFRMVFRKASVDAEKERLYEQHKHRFKGYVFQSLYQVLYEGFERALFDTHELCVYDGNKLIAVSFYDVGNKSLASILGLYDQNYEKYSLGLYTMLAEVLFGQREGMKFYYPGYILNNNKSFDYKLRLGPMQFYDWNGRWRNLSSLPEVSHLDEVLKQRMTSVSEGLSKLGVAHKTLHYPYFALGFMPPFQGELVRSVLLITFRKNPSGRIPLVEYDIDKGTYKFSEVVEAREYDFLITTELNPTQSSKLFRYFKTHCEESNLERFIKGIDKTYLNSD